LFDYDLHRQNIICRLYVNVQYLGLVGLRKNTSRCLDMKERIYSPGPDMRRGNSNRKNKISCALDMSRKNAISSSEYG